MFSTIDSPDLRILQIRVILTDGQSFLIDPSAPLPRWTPSITVLRTRSLPFRWVPSPVAFST